MPKGEHLAEFNRLRAEQLREELFTKYVVDENGCWNFTGNLTKDGYGKTKRFGKTIGAAKVFYEKFKGEIQKGLWLLHKCDNPRCVNPDHLYVGTQLDNERDKTNRGRRPPSPSITHPERLPRGEQHHRYGKGMPENIAKALLEANVGRHLSNSHKERLSPLTAEQVRCIKNDPRAQWRIAVDYGISQSTVSKIKRGVRWQHID